MFEFNATVTFLGQRHEIGTFLRDYISLQMLCESTIGVTLKRKPVVREMLIQHVPILWSGENRAVHSDSDLMDVLAKFEAKKGTTTSSAPSTSTATNRRRMEVGSSSTSAPADNNNQTIPPTFATVTRVLWYSNTPAPSSNENQFGSSSQQDVSQSVPNLLSNVQDEFFCCHGCIWTVG
ncbi:hypothetical protein ACOSQ4_024327 [Xanthoceras sorbifolium]